MVRANMFVATKDLNQKGINAHINAYRQRFKTNFDIQINDYTTNANLTNLAGETEKLREFSEAKKAGLLDTIKIWPSFFGFGAAALGIAGGIALTPALLVFTAAGAAFGAIYLLQCKSKRTRITRDCDNEYQLNEGILNNIVNDFSAYREEYNEYDAYAQKIEEEFNKI